VQPNEELAEQLSYYAVNITVLQSHSGKILRGHDSSALLHTKGYTTLFFHNTEKKEKKLSIIHVYLLLNAELVSASLTQDLIAIQPRIFFPRSYYNKGLTISVVWRKHGTNGDFDMPLITYSALVEAGYQWRI
jgi:hypothetical protein